MHFLRYCSAWAYTNGRPKIRRYRARFCNVITYRDVCCGLGLDSLPPVAKPIIYRSFSYGIPRAFGGRDDPIKPASTTIVKT